MSIFIDRKVGPVPPRVRIVFDALVEHQSKTQGFMPGPSDNGIKRELSGQNDPPHRCIASLATSRLSQVQTVC